MKGPLDWSKATSRRHCEPSNQSRSSPVREGNESNSSDYPLVSVELWIKSKEQLCTSRITMWRGG